MLVKTAFIIVVTVAIFWILFSRIDVGSVFNIVVSADLFFISAALLLTLLFPLLNAFRWKNIVSSLDYDVSYLDSLKMILGSFPLNSVTPSKAGDAIKIYFLRRRVSKTKVLGAVLGERVLDLGVLMLFAVFGALSFFDLKLIALLGIAFAGLFIFIFLMLSDLRSLKRFRIIRRSGFTEKIENVQLSFKSLSRDRYLLMSAILTTVMIWFLAIVQSSLFFSAVGVSVPFLKLIALMPIAIFIGLIPVTLGGMGTRDSAIMMIFSQYGPQGNLLGAGILFSIFRYWLLSVIGMPFFISLSRRVK